ncbi:glutamate 5-kinase [Halomonas alimentaria]|uniref:Glutamate 5-kinase n=1 Tax=Halomonas alimentaria TaxID=147248 RepID=A0A7X5APC9_9GAMM|nr:glutamate 5-kinase [Halomonas alimentaria]NAW35000.1 glutamate 5-kinase [Halomonas alimentaria]
MGLKADLEESLAEAFDTDLADAVSEFSGVHMGEVVYDPVEMEYTAEETPFSGRGVFTDYTLWELDTLGIPATDVKLICLANEIDRVPEVDDKIEDLAVKSVERDPVSATLEIQLGVV